MDTTPGALSVEWSNFHTTSPTDQVCTFGVSGAQAANFAIDSSIGIPVTQAFGIHFYYIDQDTQQVSPLYTFQNNRRLLTFTVNPPPSGSTMLVITPTCDNLSLEGGAVAFASYITTPQEVSPRQMQMECTHERAR